MFNNTFLILLILFVFSYQQCERGKNFCIFCEKDGKKCKQCENEHLFEPDEEGGCKGQRHCEEYSHRCTACNTTSNLCQTCDEGFVPDNNGGCSTTENCEIAENGQCILCKNNYKLIYKGNPYLECVSLDSEELLYCNEDNITMSGHCTQCKENYYLNEGDYKCSNTPRCYSSTKGICDKCEYDFYLNYATKLCHSNEEKNNFWKCSVSQDGKTCSQCLTPYYLSENNLCVKSKYCKIGEFGLGKCQQCKENHFLAKDRYSCTISDNCELGNEYNDRCETCSKGFYINLDNGICFSNKEDNDYKYCFSVKGENCIECLDGYYLGDDKKCSNSTNCSEISNGICTKCQVNYHIGKLDLKCNNVDKCIKSISHDKCDECDKGYYLFWNECKDDTNYKNCKKGEEYNNIVYCNECKSGYYLNESDFKCYSNDNKYGNFYKCSKVGINSEGKEQCKNCEDNFYLGDDKKCNSIYGCIKSHEVDKCLECKAGMCLNKGKNTCTNNTDLNSLDPDNYICFRCIEADEYGKKCETCEQNFTLSSGYCVDDSLCDKKIGNNCIQCKQNVQTEDGLASYCLNDKFGCVNSLDGCFECNDETNFNNCSKCFDGFYFDDENNYCFDCQDGCDICTNMDNCGKCKEEGYYTITEASSAEAYDAVCGACQTGCKICTNPDECEICKPGYFLNNENTDNYMKCSECTSNCEECLDENVCLKCNEGYELTFNKSKIVCEKKQN